MTTREDIVSFIREAAPDDLNEILLADGFEDAFIGLGAGVWNGPLVAVYSRRKVIANLTRQFSDDEDPEATAEEFFDFNVAGGYVGERTPIFILDF